MSNSASRVLGRITLLMLVVGLGIGLTSLLVWEWIEALLLPEPPAEDLSLEEEIAVETERGIIGGYTPLVFLIFTAVSATVTAAILGVFEGLRGSGLRHSAVVGIGCFAGAVLLVVTAGVFIGFTGAEDPEPDEAEMDDPPEPPEEDDELGVGDILSLAGLTAMVSFAIGIATSSVGGRKS